MVTIGARAEAEAAAVVIENEGLAASTVHKKQLDVYRRHHSICRAPIWRIAIG